VEKEIGRDSVRTRSGVAFEAAAQGADDGGSLGVWATREEGRSIDEGD